MPEDSSIQRRVFTGTSYCSLDQQRRILMPREWRLDSDSGNTKFYIVPAAPNIVKIYDQEHFDKFISYFNQLDENDPDVQDAQMLMGALTSTITPDKQGRFSLSNELIEFGGFPTDGTKLVLVGAITYGRIVTLETWTQCKGNPLNLRKIDEKMSELRKLSQQKLNIAITPQQ